MPVPALDPAVRATLRAVACHGLTAEGEEVALRPLDDGQWRSLVAAIRAERLAGLLDRAVADGAVPASPSQADDAEEVAAAYLHGVLRVERSLVDVAACLGRDGVPFLVLKGPAVAHLDEPDPAVRHYVDLDLLVRGDMLPPALASLATMGYGRDLPERRAGFDRRFGKEVSLVADRRLELDLHRTLALGSFGLRLDLGAFWESTASFGLAGIELTALDAEGRFVHACVNAMLGDARPRLVALRDVVRISTTHRLRPERLRRVAPAGGGAAVVAAAARTCLSTLGVPVGEEAAAFVAATVPSRWERVALRAYRSQGGSNTLELLSGALGVTGADRARYLRALLAPDAAYVAARRSTGRPPEWGTGLREVVRRRRPVRTVEGRGD